MSETGGEDDWAPLAERFVDHHYSSLRGRVRTHVIDQHLRRHLGPPPQRVVDVGGGAGNQSVPLAQIGHDVTILDPSAAMLERAGKRIKAEDRRPPLAFNSSKQPARTLLPRSVARFSTLSCATAS